MAKKPQYVVQYNGEQYEIPEPGLSVLVKFEKHFGIPSSVLEPEVVDVLDAEGLPVLDREGKPKQKVVSEFRIEWLAFIFWASMIRMGMLPEGTAFDDDFLDGIEDVIPVEPENEEESSPVDPTVPAPPTD